MAGVNLKVDIQLEAMKSAIEEDSPEKDRIADFTKQIEWLREAGFGSVDHIWHFWMEHFIIARK